MKTKRKIKLDKWRIEDDVLKHLPCESVARRHSVSKKGRIFKSPRWICNACDQTAPKEIAFSADITNCDEWPYIGVSSSSLGDLLKDRYASMFAQQVDQQLMSYFKDGTKDMKFKVKGEGFFFPTREDNDSE